MQKAGWVNWFRWGCGVVKRIARKSWVNNANLQDGVSMWDVAEGGELVEIMFSSSLPF